MFKYTSVNLNKVEQAVKESGYILRYEKGGFNPGYCILEEKNVVVVNKYYSLEAKINCLLEIVNQIKPSSDLLSDRSRLFLSQAAALNQAS